MLLSVEWKLFDKFPKINDFHLHNNIHVSKTHFPFDHHSHKF